MKEEKKVKRSIRLIFSCVTLAAIIGIGSQPLAAQRPHGAVYGWGNNSLGELNNGSSTAEYSAPVALADLGDVVEVMMGAGNSTLALKADGTVWGRGNNGGGQLGNGTYTDSAVLVQAQGLSNVVQISGSTHFVALKADGTVWTWGANTDGQLGYDTGNYISSNVPQQVPGLTNVVNVT